MYKLYGMPISRALRVSWTCEELGVEYEFVPTSPQKGETQSAEFLAMNPAGKIPVLQDGELVISESAAICTYLADKHSEPPLIPVAGTPERARHDALCWFALTDLEAPLWTISKHKIIYPEDQRVPGIIDTSLREWARSLNAFKTEFDTGPFAMGESFTTADILFGHILRWARNSKFAPVEDEVLLEYVERLSARAALQRALAHAK